MSVHEFSATRVKFRNKVAAPVHCACGQCGTAIWEESVVVSRTGLKREVIEVSSGFYLRINKKDNAVTEIACALCERVVGFNRRQMAGMLPPWTG